MLRFFRSLRTRRTATTDTRALLDSLAAADARLIARTDALLGR